MNALSEFLASAKPLSRSNPLALRSLVPEEIGAVNVRLGQVGARQIRACQIGIRQIGARKVSAPQDNVAHDGALSRAKLSCARPMSARVSEWPQQGSRSKVGAPNVLDEARGVRGCAMEIGEVGTGKIRAREGSQKPRAAHRSALEARCLGRK